MSLRSENILIQMSPPEVLSRPGRLHVYFHSQGRLRKGRRGLHTCVLCTWTVGDTMRWWVYCFLSSQLGRNHEHAWDVHFKKI